jgi:TonB-dependent receptor
MVYTNVSKMSTGFFVLLIVSALVLWSGVSYAQTAGLIVGRVLDGADGSPLWGVNVTIKGTSLGASTNDEGRFKISNVPPGTYTLSISYLGYEKAERQVRLDVGATADVEVRLTQSVIIGQEVVVTAQLKGQQAAINQQLTSNSIVNILSQERIRELPDQNAAEAISRLPGISVQRDGGEAQKVVIRGLSPKYSNITINGEKIPSTDLEDRSVDLSSVSSDMLAGIEVYKSPSADKDGDAVGGTVNFAMKKAPEGQMMDVKFQGGNNSLEKDYGDYKGSLNLSRRFFDDMLGLVLTGNIQRANRGSDAQEESYSLSYEPIPDAPVPYKIDDMRLVDRKEIRKRYGASVALDYDLGTSNSFLVTGFWSKTDRDEIRRRHRFNVQESREEFDLTDHMIGTQLFTVGVDGTHNVRLPLVGILDLTWHIAASQSDQKNPLELYTRFFRMGLPGVIADQGPEVVPTSVPGDMNNTWLKEMTYSTDRVTDKNKTYQFDAKSNYSLGDVLSGSLKLGGKLTQKSRERNRSQIISNTVIETDLGLAIFNNPTTFYRSFPLTSDVNHKVLMSGFVSSDDQIGEFLSGKYSSWPTLSGQAIHELWDNLRYWITPRGVALFDNTMTVIGDQQASDASYTAKEDVFAGYVMTEINIGRDIMVLPGIRYERTKNNYKTIFAKTSIITDETPSISAMQDSTGDRSYEVLLPMVQARVNMFEGMMVRASVAKTISRPNYFDLVPYEMITRSGSPKTIQKGNPSLLHTAALNYDLYLSLFNRYGLFSVGGFYKTLDNISYLRTSYIQSGTYKGFQLTQPVNADDPSTVYGGEIEVQANLTLLPSPFDGIIIAGNLAYMKSKTLYPRFQVTNQVITKPPFLIVSVVDTVREAPMPGQADKMGNLTLGYERGGFSGRLSLVFQGRSLAIVGTRAETDGYTDAYYRWDLAVQQKVLHGISLFFNVNNITAAADQSSNQRFLTAEQYYGWGAELGVRYRF